MPGMLKTCLLIIGGVTIISQTIYALKGQIFEYDGRLAAREILFSVICFQCIMQFGFGFALYAVNQTDLQNRSYDSAYEYFIDLQQLAPGNNPDSFLAIDLEEDMPEYIESVVILRKETGVLDGYFRFPITGGSLIMKKNEAYFREVLKNFAMDMLMSLIISVLLMVEIVYLMAKYLDNGMRGERNTAVGYLRQFSFLFYFAGFLGASFVPILARDLYGDSPNANFIAGLPYSVEALFNCAAILSVAPIFRKYGWKPPYAMGVIVFSLGLLLSAAATGVFFFIFSRAVVGLGYGLCWMLLRNITTIDDNRRENFGSLTAGTYAGIMSGIAFGAVLADKIGYSGVLLISACLSLVLLAFPMLVRNEKPTEIERAGGMNIKLLPRDIAVLGVFLCLIVIPTVIADAFCDYVSPLYINDLGLPTSYVGRVTLLYNLCIVYISTTVMMKLIVKIFKSELMRNISHMAFISLALFCVAYIGGFGAILIAAVILGSGDGFGFSVQNAYLLNSRVSQKLGVWNTLTYLSLFKKFAAMLAPMVFSMFLGIAGGLAVMAVIFIGCAVVCLAAITMMSRNGVN